MFTIRDISKNATALAFYTIIAVAFVQLLVNVRFAWSLLRYGRYTLTSGTEELNIYAIAKLQAGESLYQPVNAPPYAFVPYNFGFYHFYRFVLDLLGARHDMIFVEGRWITFAFAVLAVMLFYLCAKELLAQVGIRCNRLECFALVSVGWLAFLGNNFSGSWAWTLRPDLAAIACGLSGLLVFLRNQTTKSLMGYALAGGLYSLGWAFKQSAVWFFFSVALWLSIDWFRAAIRNKGRASLELLRVVAFCIPMALMISAVLMVLGPDYRYNVITAQSINALHLAIFKVSLPSVLGNAFLFLFFPISLALEQRSGVTQLSATHYDGLWRLAYPLVGAINFLQALREGSAKNQLYEFLSLSALLAVVALVRWNRTDATRRALVGVVGLVLLTPLALTSLLMLALPNKIGIQIPATAETEHQILQLLAWYRAQPEPRFADDGLLALPWYTGEDHYPQFIMLDTYFVKASEKGLLASDYLFQAIGSPQTVVLGQDSLGKLMKQFEAAGYRYFDQQSPASRQGFSVLRKIPAGVEKRTHP